MAQPDPSITALAEAEAALFGALDDVESTAEELDRDAAAALRARAHGMVASIIARLRREHG